MAKFESSVEINRSVDEVFAFLADPSNETRWQSGLIDSRITSDGPLAVGSTGRDIRKSMDKVIWPIISGVGKKPYLRDFAKLKEVLEAEPS